MEEGAMGREREREHRKISDIQLKLNRNIGHSRICFISHLRSPDLTNSSALPPNRRIPAGFEPPVKNPFPCPNEMCWTSLFPLLCFFVFVYFSVHIYKKRRWDRILKKNYTNKHLDDKFTSSPFNPQPKTTTGLTGHTRVPGTVPQQRSNCNCMNSQWQYQDGSWDSIWDIEEDYSNNKHCTSIWTGLNLQRESKPVFVMVGVKNY